MTHAFHASGPPESTGLVPAPPHEVVHVVSRRGWWQRHWKWAIPAGVVTLMAGLGGLVVLLLAVIFGLIRNCEAYQTAVAEAAADPTVVAAIGAPVEEGFFVMGNVEAGPGSGHADLAIPIKGPKGEATVYVVADKSGGRWGYSTLEVAVHDTRQRVDLLSGW